jgi:hypothetical protein
VGAGFSGEYVDRLADHVAAPDERGLESAYALGRRALAEAMTVLELVTVHQDALHKIAGDRTTPSEHADSFLREALGAFEIARSGRWEAQQHARLVSDRVELLHDLNEAYLAVLAASTLDERVAEVKRRVVRLVDAERAEVVLEPKERIAPPEGALVVDLPGGVGQIHVWPRRDQRHEDVGERRSAVAELAHLVGGPLRDARLLRLSGSLAELGAVLVTATEPGAVVSAVIEHGPPVTGARRAVVLLRDSEMLRAAGISGGQWSSGDGAEAVALSRLLAEVGSGGDGVFVRQPDGPLAGSSCAVVPLEGSSERSGAVALLFDAPQSFDIVQRTFLGNVADRIAAALERSVVFARERVARVEAQAAADRYRSLQQFAGDLSGSVTRRHIADLLLRRLQLAQRASVGFVASYEADQQRMEVLARLGAAVLPDRWSVEPTFLDELRGEPLIIHGVAEIARRLRTPDIELPGVDAIALFALGQRDPVGLVLLGWPATEAYRASGAGAVRADVALAAAALRRAEHFDVEHDIAQTLQRQLLTIPPTNIDGLRWAVRYQAGSAGLAGGDWYDVIALDERAVLLVIGDVVGKGVQAAASVSQLRSACRALARKISDPLELMLALDEFAVAVDEGVYSSLGLLRLDVTTGQLDQVLAGHPPPALVHPCGAAEILPASQGAVLGLSSARERARIEMPPEALLLLYTDGLVERRGELLDIGFERLTGLLAGMYPPFDPQWTCDWLIGELANDAPTADDTAVLAVVRDPS